MAQSSWKDHGKDRPAVAGNKHEIRRHFHHQIKKLWNTHPTLLKNEENFSQENSLSSIFPTMIFGGIGKQHTIRNLANKFEFSNYKFVPLITKELCVLCEIDIILLRPGDAGNLYSAGDIDNRLKTLLDSLAMPQHLNQLGDNEYPAEDERPFFCLLEDDSLISKVSVEADALLEPTEGGRNDARAIINIHTKPTIITANNVGFT